MYVIEPEDLRFKLEAINYKATVTRSEISPITMDTLSAVKTQIQQSLAKASSSKTQPNMRNFSTAQVNRSRMPAHMAATNRSMASQPSAQNGGLVKQDQFLVASTATANSTTSSKVVFVGPSMSQEAKKKRACELFLFCSQAVTNRFKIAICTRRYRREAKVSGDLSVYLWLLTTTRS